LVVPSGAEAILSGLSGESGKGPDFCLFLHFYSMAYGLQSSLRQSPCEIVTGALALVKDNLVEPDQDKSRIWGG
jgi:hypothetical protein